MQKRRSRNIVSPIAIGNSVSTQNDHENASLNLTEPLQTLHKGEKHYINVQKYESNHTSIDVASAVRAEEAPHEEGTPLNSNNADY